MDIQAQPIVEVFRSFRDPSKAFAMGIAVLNGRLIRFGVELPAPANVSQDAIEASAKPILDEWWQGKLAQESRHEQKQCGGIEASCVVCMVIEVAS